MSTGYFKIYEPKTLRLDGTRECEPKIGEHPMICQHCGGPNDGPNDTCFTCCTMETKEFVTMKIHVLA